MNPEVSDLAKRLLYRGGTPYNPKLVHRDWLRGMPLTTNKDTAIKFAHGKNELSLLPKYEYIKPRSLQGFKINKRARIADIKSDQKLLDRLIGNFSEKHKGIPDESQWSRFYNYMRQRYDAIDFRPISIEDEVRVLNPKILKRIFSLGPDIAIPVLQGLGVDIPNKPSEMQEFRRRQYQKQVLASNLAA